MPNPCRHGSAALHARVSIQVVSPHVPARRTGRNPPSARATHDSTRPGDESPDHPDETTTGRTRPVNAPTGVRGSSAATTGHHRRAVSHETNSFSHISPFTPFEVNHPPESERIRGPVTWLEAKTQTVRKNIRRYVHPRQNRVCSSLHRHRATETALLTPHRSGRPTGLPGNEVTHHPARGSRLPTPRCRKVTF